MGEAVLCLLIAVLALSSCGGHKDGGNDHGHGRREGHDEHGHGHGHGHGQSNSTMELARPNSMFAFSLYKQIVSQPEYQDSNVFFSPVSLSVALAALTLGARGETYDALFNGLALNNSDITEEGVHEGFRDILQNLNEQKGIDLNAGSALFVSDAFKPKASFLEDLKTFYLSEGFTTDFTKNTEAAKMINDYVKTKTNGKISNLVDQLDPATVMYLVSYIYFKGKWEIPFDPEKTKDGLFKVNDTKRVPVKMMTKMDRYDLYRDYELSTTVLRLPYTKSVSMMLLLPDKGLTGLEDVVCPDHVAKWHRWMKERYVVVSIPKLSIETSYSLRNLLSGMGMADIFSYSANFSGIADDPVLVSEVIQKATLDVDETGSTATAATGVGFMPMSATYKITFDRPFMVLISNRDTRSILFLGKVVNPAKK
ncbi:serine protease inhibitor A3N-like [Sardina pilchardus]|uniref:serine protease inhibitor A3N-like n=1 Tax=Sardina pilchardus TaxID=27697 RepID=UPI002E0F384F